MKREHIKERYKQQIMRALDYHFPHAKKIYLFGSRALLTHKDSSDVDIAVDCGQRINIGEVQRARVTLNNLPIALTVDLVDMHRIPKELHDVIVKEGVLWKS